MANASFPRIGGKPHTTLSQLAKVAPKVNESVTSTVASQDSHRPTQDSAQKKQPPKKVTISRTYKPHPLETLLGDVVIDAKGNVISPKLFSVENGVIGLYFAAHWCPPCRTFCPNLMLLYHELRKAEESFEVIYISLDSKESSFREYLAKMPWFAVPFTEEEKREEIALNFGIKGIPVLVLLDAKTLDMIAFNGREIVFRDPRGALFPWKDMPAEEPPRVSVGSSNSARVSTSSRTGSMRMSTDQRRRASESRAKSPVTSADNDKMEGKMDSLAQPSRHSTSGPDPPGESR